ncbi:MAG: MFS transporter, partial [Gammaproteobacteria bacterium]|nr:MFS transporter [Gammaproteobacteria bacterium]
MTSAPDLSGLRTAAVRVIVPFALGYFLSYLFRAVNAVIAPDLIRELRLDANTLGLLTSIYFLTFAAFQLPLGVLLDRYGARRTECTLLLIAAAGSVIFALADGVAGLIAGRA